MIQRKEATVLKNSVFLISQCITQKDAFTITTTRRTEEDLWEPTQVRCAPILLAVLLTTSAFITGRIA